MPLFNEYTDMDLLALLSDSELRAFNEIYHRYWKFLYCLAANKLNNLTDAEEVVQDIFADLWLRRKDICITSSLKAYLAGAVK